MAEVRPDEVSAIPRTAVGRLRDRGKELERSRHRAPGGRRYRPHSRPLQSADRRTSLEFRERSGSGVVLNLSRKTTSVVRYCLGNHPNIRRRRRRERRTGQIASIKVGDGMVGRVVDTLGTPDDGNRPDQR